MRFSTVSAALLVAGLVGGGLPTAGAAPTLPARAVRVLQADDGLKVETTSSFVVDPAAGAIHVSVEATVTNQSPDRVSGGSLLQSYFPEFGVPALIESENFVATRADGTALSVDVESVDDPFVEVAAVDLKPDLFYGQSQSIRLTYDLPNQPARSPGLSRANEAFITFPVFAYGDAGMTSVSARIPEQYEIEVSGELTETQEGNETVLTANGIPDPENFFAFVVGKDDSKLVSREVDIDGAPLTVRGWPDDTEWADFVAEQVGSAKTALTELTGLSWPDKELEVLETVSVYAYGYSGWFNPAEHSISISDELDSRVIFHELCHLWFNDRLFSDRWVNEGYAEEYAQTALDQLGQAQVPAEAPDRAGEVAFPLNEWGNPSFLDVDSAAAEEYGYSASWWVLDQLGAEIGVEKMRAVLEAADAGKVTYVGDPEPENFTSAASWMRLYDLLEMVGGSQQTAALFDTWVLTDAQKAEVAARATARGAYAALEERGGAWSPPFDVRRDMSSWSFDDATEEMTTANAVLDLRDQILAELEGTGIAPKGLEEQYETAKDISSVGADAELTLDAAKDYEAAAERYDDGAGLLGTIGLLGSGTDGTLDDAASALSEGEIAASMKASRDVEDAMDGAARDGALRLGGVGAVGALAAGIPVIRRKARRRRVVKEAERITEQASRWNPMGPMGPMGPPSGPPPLRVPMPTSPPTAPNYPPPPGPPGGPGGPPSGSPQTPPSAPPGGPPQAPPSAPPGGPPPGRPSGSPPSGPPSGVPQRRPSTPPPNGGSPDRRQASPSGMPPLPPRRPPTAPPVRRTPLPQRPPVAPPPSGPAHRRPGE